MTEKQAERLTRILSDQIVGLQIWKQMKTEGNLLYEAEWQIDCLGSIERESGEEGLEEEGYTLRDLNALRRYARRLRAKGVRPEPWEE